MHALNGSLKNGFTLIEVLVALVIISVGVLSLGGFSLSSLGSDQVSRERLTAVHLAEQILEEWQQAGVLPVLDTSNYCKAVATWNISTAPTVAPCPTTKTVTISTASCTPLFGTQINYNIVVKESPLCGPSKVSGSSYVFFNGTVAVPKPVTKVVTVSWQHKGSSHSVYLTHLSKVQ